MNSRPPLASCRWLFSAADWTASEPSSDLKSALDVLSTERSPFRLIGEMLAFDRLFDTFAFSLELEFEIDMLGTLNSFFGSFGSCSGRCWNTRPGLKLRCA